MILILDLIIIVDTFVLDKGVVHSTEVIMECYLKKVATHSVVSPNSAFN